MSFRLGVFLARIRVETDGLVPAPLDSAYRLFTVTACFEAVPFTKVVDVGAYVGAYAGPTRKQMLQEVKLRVTCPRCLIHLDEILVLRGT